jgi:hypothetical protein
MEERGEDLGPDKSRRWMICLGGDIRHKRGKRRLKAVLKLCKGSSQGFFIPWEFFPTYLHLCLLYKAVRI